jgi:hypothetical protein
MAEPPSIATVISTLNSGRTLDCRSGSIFEQTWMTSTHVEHDDDLRLRGVVTKKFTRGLTLPAFPAKHALQLHTRGTVLRTSSGLGTGFRRDAFAVPGFVILKLFETGEAMGGRLIGSGQKRLMSRTTRSF